MTVSPSILAPALLLGATFCSSLPNSLHAQTPTPTERTVMAVVDSAMTFIQSGDMARLSDLMTPEAQVYASSTRDGAPGFRLRTAASQRALGQRPPIIERGFDADLRVAGTIAVVWLPYDLYVDNKWSHCGVDVFTLVQVATSWRIANLTYSVEQPPACRVNPSGPAAGTTGTPNGSPEPPAGRQ
jgi:hypothetical protein